MVLGCADGKGVGGWIGVRVGFADGITVDRTVVCVGFVVRSRAAVPCKVGIVAEMDGAAVGDRTGARVGSTAVGDLVGNVADFCFLAATGWNEGKFVGPAVGKWVGALVGASVFLSLTFSLLAATTVGATMIVKVARRRVCFAFIVQNSVCSFEECYFVSESSPASLQVASKFLCRINLFKWVFVLKFEIRDENTLWQTKFTVSIFGENNITV